MQTDLHDFLSHFFGTIAMTMVPVVLIAFTTLPMSLHHHIGTPSSTAHVAPQHMT
ncbi:MAG: hypothetical protein QFE16_08355 [Pseudomonadota bacterium]|nr:hypothetical protein [Pseudomonadota bacterium]